MVYAKITGIGAYLPEKVLTNHDLEKMVDTTHDWIVARTGIHERHIAHETETTLTLAEHAAREALADANVDPQQLDLILVTTTTPEYFYPTTACLLQRELQASQCMAFDLSAACSGFAYAMSIADQYIRTQTAKTILIVGSEIPSRILNWKDRDTCVLFGDGAGAVVVQASDEPGVIDTKMHASGSQPEILSSSTGIFDQVKPSINMQGRELYKVAVSSMSQSVKEILAANQMTNDDLDWVIPHQANARIVELAMSRIKFPKEKTVLTVDKHANTISASIPLALYDAVKKGQVKRGQTLLFEAFGAGLTWGAVLLKY